MNKMKVLIGKIVLATRKINGKTLDSDITLGASDVGALPRESSSVNTNKISGAVIVSSSAPVIQDGKIWLKPID